MRKVEIPSRQPQLRDVPWSNLRRFEEAKSLLRKTMPVARRVIGESDEVTLRMRSVYALALCKDTGATLDDLREGVTTLEETERIARRVLGGAHPLVTQIARSLGRTHEHALGARDGTTSTPSARPWRRWAVNKKTLFLLGRPLRAARA